MVYAKDNYLALQFIKYTNIANIERTCIKDAFIVCMLLVGVCVHVCTACSVYGTGDRGNINNNNTSEGMQYKNSSTNKSKSLNDEDLRTTR